MDTPHLTKKEQELILYVTLVMHSWLWISIIIDTKINSKQNFSLEVLVLQNPIEIIRTVFKTNRQYDP